MCTPYKTRTRHCYCQAVVEILGGAGMFPTNNPLTNAQDGLQR